jgi:hypothetical protein
LPSAMQLSGATSAWNNWFVDGKQWTVDETREMWSLARKFAAKLRRVTRYARPRASLMKRRAPPW